jgi:hypothetical protein
MRMRQWRSDQASNDRVQKATVNSTLDVHDYQSRDGHEIQLDNSYDRVFQDVGGNLIMTNDLSYNPSTDPKLTGDWARLRRVR